MIQAGEIGDVWWLRSQDCFAPPAGNFKGSWRADVKLQGGGVLVDTGYHPTYRLYYLADSPVVGVRGSMARRRVEIEGEDIASVQVRFANGAIGEILTSWAFQLPYGSHMIHAVGEKGQIFGSGNELFLLPNGEKEPQKRVLSGGDLFGDQMEHLADCLIGGTQPIHGAEEGRAVLQIIRRASDDAEGWQEYTSA